jgi:Fur family peroxide stress response transcriptional regulator
MKRNFSSKRNAIYNTILSTTTHPSARWIYEQLKPDYPDLSLGTERIDGNTSPHTHFVCNCCGRVIDVADDGSKSSESLALLNKGFTIESKLVIYYGKCSDCCNN